MEARDGVYTDSLRKHIQLVLLVCESTGAVNRAGVTLLRSLERATRRKRSRVQDGTLSVRHHPGLRHLLPSPDTTSRSSPSPSRGPTPLRLLPLRTGAMRARKRSAA